MGWEDTLELESKNNLNLNVFEINVNVKDDLSVISIPLLFCIWDPESEPIDLLMFEN